MGPTEAFEAERARLVAIASRVLADPVEAEDVVQQAWLRLASTDAEILSLPAWLTTVTTRLCLDRLKARVPVPTDEVGEEQADPDPADEVALTEAVGAALRVVLDRLSPSERVAYVLHDSFAIDFRTVALVLDTTPAAARQLASRARHRIGRPIAGTAPADWEVVDAFMEAAKEGKFDRLIQMLAPDVAVTGDRTAILLGTPERIEGRRAVAEFFDGSAHSALAVFARERAAAAWFDRGVAKVVFDFAIVDGVIHGIRFAADPTVVAEVVRRLGPDRRG
ncbi:sigma-70 family RNA polymerase sigma factor [Aeromicrobium sp.]|uniref:sigma-70 family RNA polymerase sigma factor n=1 Tax=Aeromicrobium sp. TaxID=1871063 RepID=UPI003C358BA6